MSWTLIEHQALTSSVASVILGNGGTIPQTYKSLRLVVSARADSGNMPGGNATFLTMSLNGSAFTSVRGIYGLGTTAGSYNTGAGLGPLTDPNTTASTFSSFEVVLPNYSAASSSKAVSMDVVAENNATAAQAHLVALLYNAPSSAVTSITLATSPSANLVAGSTFTLYGLK